MSEKTGIEWTDSTWNPIRGCSRISPGCMNCYAERVAARFSDPGLAFHGFARDTVHGPRWTGKVAIVERHLLDPLGWRKPRRVFVNSMSDLFHEALPDEAIDRVFAVMALAPQHTFQILTKRAARMLAYLGAGTDNREHAVGEVMRHLTKGADPGLPEFPLPNVWLGVSTEDQESADKRIPALLQTPAAVRFVSAEPLLGLVDLKIGRYVILPKGACTEAPRIFPGASVPPGIYEAASNKHGALSVQSPAGALGIKPGEFEWAPRLDWVIAGGESGPGARPCDVGWIRSIVAQCKAAGVAAFVKQLGRVVSWDGVQGGYMDGPSNVWPRPTGHWPDPEMPGGFVKHLVDRKGGDPEEWPEDLRIREFPSGS